MWIVEFMKPPLDPKRAFIGKCVNGSRYLHARSLQLLSDSEQDRVHKAEAVINSRPWNVVRLNLHEMNDVSLMLYEGFDASWFPELRYSFKIDLAGNEFKKRKYSQENPPILHRKELLIDPNEECYVKYESFTKMLEEKGAFVRMHLFGTKLPWFEHLRTLGIQVEGI